MAMVWIVILAFVMADVLFVFTWDAWSEGDVFSVVSLGALAVAFFVVGCGGVWQGIKDWKSHESS